MKARLMVLFFVLVCVVSSYGGDFVPVAVDTNTGAIAPTNFISFLPITGATNAVPVYTGTNSAYIYNGVIYVAFDTNFMVRGITNILPVYTSSNSAYRHGNTAYVAFDTNATGGGASGITNLATVYSSANVAYRSGNMGYVSFNTNVVGITNIYPSYSNTNTAYIFGNRAYVVFNTNVSSSGGSITVNGANTLVYTNNIVGASRIEGTNFILGTNAMAGDVSISPSNWSHYSAQSNVNVNSFEIQNASRIVVTGRLVIGFGLFTSSNDVPAPISSNVWYVYALVNNGTNYLQGVDWKTNRVWVGSKP